MAERTRTRSATRRPAEAQVLTSPLADRRLEAVGEEPVSPDISTAPADLVEDLEVIGAPRRTRSSSGAFPDARARRRYRLMLALLIVLAVGFAAGLLAIDNPMPPGSRGFWLIAEMRAIPLFERYWQATMDRPAVVSAARALLPLALRTRAGQSFSFRLSSEPFVDDARFRIVYYFPDDVPTMTAFKRER